MIRFLDFTLNSIFHKPFCFFAQSKKFNKFNQSQAILASRIIKQITKNRFNNQMEKQLEKESLHDKILRLVRESQFEKQVKQSISDIFFRGFTINQPIWGQQQKLQQEKTNLDHESAKLYTFCPTYQITGEIFNHIFKKSINSHNSLYVGYFGISKTLSLLLYSILSQKIIQYNLSRHKQKSQKVARNKDIYASKMVYISYQPTEHFVQSLQNNIKMQCRELFDESNCSFSFSDIKEQYAKHRIKTALVIDQTDQMAKAFRHFFQAIEIRRQIDQKFKDQSYDKQKQISQAEIKSIIKISWQQIDKKHELASKTMRLINQNQHTFDSMIFISPYRIQNKICHYLNLGGQAGHSDIQTDKIYYRQFFERSEFKKQIVDYFLFQLHHRFLVNFDQFKQFYHSLDDQDILLKQKIRSNLLEKMVNNPCLFTTPLFIRISLVKQWEVYKNQHQQQNIKFQNIEDLSVHLFEKVFVDTEQQIAKKVKKFFIAENFQGPQRDDLIIKLYYEARKILKSLPGQTQIPPVSLYFSYDVKQKIKYKLDKDLFFLDKMQSSVRCLLSAKQIVDILGQYVTDILKKIAYKQNQGQFLDYFDHFIKEQIFQDMFIRQITAGSSLLSIQKKKKTALQSVQKVKIAPQVYSFAPIPKIQSQIERKNYHFLQSLLPSLEKIAKSQKTTNSVFLPTISKNQSLLKQSALKKSFAYQHKFTFAQIKTIRQNQSINFIITQINDNLCHITINAFCMSLWKWQESGFDKINEFIKNYINFADFQQTQTTLNGKKYTLHLKYYVLAPNLARIYKNQSVHLQVLKKISKGKLQFSQQAENARILSVRGPNQSKVLLNQIGIIDVKNDIIVTNQSDISFEKYIFERVCLQRKS